jgi:HSP20 family protein
MVNLTPRLTKSMVVAKAIGGKARRSCSAAGNGRHIMNVLARWNQSRLNQLNEIDDLQHKLRNLVRRSRASRPGEKARLAQWIPLVDVSEDAQGYVIKTELPQVNKEDVRITWEDGMLTIMGERKCDQNGKKDHPLALADGRFAHSFVIPNDARPARVTTLFNDGVLLVHLTRNANASAQQFKGKVSSVGSLGLG